MPSSLHATATLTFLPMLKGLSHVLSKAEAYAAEKKIDPSVFLNARLAPDMFPLIRQVQIASDHAKGAMYRIAEEAPPAIADTEVTFADLQARIAKSIALIEEFSADKVNGREDNTFEIKFPWATMSFTGQGFLLGYAIPNFYFHVTTTYNILRENGVPLGKGDYFGHA
jgi:uncharacterized protein